MSTIPCPECTLDNPFYKVRCEVCYKHLRDPEWRCKDCQYLNPISILKCSSCSNTRSNSIKKRPQSAERKKREINSNSPTGTSNLLAVAAHGEKGRRPRSTDNRHSTRWSCCQCTLINDSENKSCDICDHAKGSCCNAILSKQWKCETCDNFNHESFTRCSFCSKKRRAQSPLAKTDGKKHKGGGKVNPQTNHEGTRPPSSKEGQLWTCKRCSSQNSSSLTSTCSKCGHNKPRIASAVAFEDKKHKRHDLRTSVRAKNLRTFRTREVEKEWKNIVMNCQQNKVNFIDYTFLPNDQSLFKKPRSAGSNIQWLRVKDVKDMDGKGPIKWKVYDKPTANDIMQGSIGNCWFICALAVVAERQKLVERIVVTKDYCPEGAYVVRLCKSGSWKTLVVDDYFPVDQYQRLKYSKAKRGQLWVPLIEKAAAKIHGCYEALSSGLTVESLALLTGEPCEHVSLREKSKDFSQTINDVLVWSRFTHARDEQYLMCTSCEASEGYSTEHCKSLGLITGHAYSLLDVQGLSSGEKLLKIRNPWGSESWKGDWSDSSPKWAKVKPEVKKKLKPDGNKHGIFWIEFKDFKKYFRSVDICKTRDWDETRIKGSFPTAANGPWKFAKIYVKQKTDLCIGLHQQNRRGNTNSGELVDMFIVVMETLKDGKLRTIGNSKRDTKSYVGCDVEHLDSGEYIIACLAFRHLSTVDVSSFQLDFVLTIHSTKTITVEENDSINAGYTHFLADLLIQTALDKGEHQTMKCNTATHSLSWDGFIYVVENRGKKNEYVEFRQDSSNSTTNLMSSRTSLLTADVIPPGQRQIVILLSRVNPMQGYSRSMQLSCINGRANKLEYFGKDLGHEFASKPHYPEIPSHLRCLHEPRPI